MSFITVDSSWAQKVLRFAGQNPVDYPYTQQIYRFEERFEEATNNKYDIKVFPANQLGDYTQIYEEVIRGSIDMALITVPSQFDKRLEITFFPYLTDDFSDLPKRFSQDGFIFKTVDKLNWDLGIKLLGFSIEGIAGIGSSKPALEPTNPAVGKGFLMRSPPLDVIKLGIMGLGFQTMSLPYAEVYSALQTGIVDGYEVGPIMIAYLNYQEITKYYYQYFNYVECNQWLINKKVWEELTPEEQKIMLEIVYDLQNKSIEMSEDLEIEYVKKWKDEGVEVVQFTKEEQSKLANHIRQTVWPQLKDQLGDDVYNGLMEAYAQ
jgi:TRAP-type C4-dicarboxylate transport system substrate-binding protein